MSTKLCALFIAFASLTVVYGQLIEFYGDCSKYRQCDSYDRCIVRSCPTGKEFNPLISNCDKPIPDRVNCNNRPNQVSSGAGAYKGPHVFLPYPGNCRRYQECAENLGGCYIRDCGPGTEFDPNVKVCGMPLVDRTNCRN